MGLDPLGIARIGGASGQERPVLVVDGPCVTSTLRDLEHGRRGTPMSRPTLEAIRGQAINIVGDIVAAYSARVAQGEVGAGGSFRASAAAPSAGESPTGLLYGRVQSGKTAAMIVTTALAVDNGFRTIIVLTSNNLELVKQTSKRFEVLNGPLVFSSLEASGGAYAWDRDRANIERWMGARGVIFVCAKEDEHLRALIRFLQQSGSFEYPALIMDDEADQATPDTTMARRSRGNPVPNASTTFRLVVGNDATGEQGLSLRETLRHNVFLQVTATPYGLLLQNLDNPLRPEFTYLLKPGDGYTGGETFFADASDPPPPPLCLVDEAESQILRSAENRVPDGLARSIAFFLLSASAHSRVHGAPPRDGYKHLCHTSASRAEHMRLADLIRQYTHELADRLDRDFASVSARPEIRWAYDELRRTVPAPPLDELLGDVARELPNRRVLVINAQGDRLDFGPQYAFVVGGNILSRGLTIDDLLVTYYFRQPRVTQMDTMHQHARMYGYRRQLMPFTRVFLPPGLARRFQHIHQSEEALRDLLDVEGTGRALPVQTAGDLRPTRTNILDVGTIAAYRPGQQVYPVEPVHDPSALRGATERIDTEVARLSGGRERPNEFIPISIDDAKRLADLVPMKEDDGEWDSEAIPQVLTVLSGHYDNRALLYVRKMERSDVSLSQGAISGAEQQQARDRGVPVLFMFKDGERRKPGASPSPWLAPFWYPTIVFPPNMPAMIFNRST